MSGNFDGNWVIFRIDNSGIKLQMPDGSVTEDITKMGDFDAVLNSMERSLRSASGNTEFRFNTGLRHSDLRTGYQYQDVAVRKDAYKTLLEVLRGWETKKELGSYGTEGQEISNTYLANADPEEAKILKFTRTIQGSRARTKMKKEAMLAGGLAEESFTEKNTERMTAYIPVRQSEYESLLEKYKDTKNPDRAARNEIYNSIFKETTAKQEAEKTLRKQAESIQEEKRKEKEEKDKEREDKNSSKRAVSKISAIIAAIVLVADILRRILSAVMQNAVQAAKDRADADNTGTGLLATRENRLLDKAKGLQEGTHAGAISSLQGKFGDITKLDTESLGILARVMGNDVVDFVESGMGGKATPMLLENILDRFFEQFKSGRNSLGMYVGQGDARRELVTVLSEISPEISAIFAKMADDYMNGAGFSNYSEWRGTTNLNRTSLLGFEQDYNAQLGNMLNEIIAAVEDLKNSFLTRLLNSMGGWIEEINNWRVGMNASENLETDKTNKQKNYESYDKLQLRESLYATEAEKAMEPYKSSLFKNAGLDFDEYDFTAEELVDIATGSYQKKKGEPKDRKKVGEAFLKTMLFTEAGAPLLKLIASRKIEDDLKEEMDKRYGEKIDEVVVTEDKINIMAQEILGDMYGNTEGFVYEDLVQPGFDTFSNRFGYARLPFTEAVRENFRTSLDELYKDEAENPVRIMRSLVFDASGKDKMDLFNSASGDAYTKKENKIREKLLKDIYKQFGDKAFTYYDSEGNASTYSYERDRRIGELEKQKGRKASEKEIRDIELDILSGSFWLDTFAGINLLDFHRGFIGAGSKADIIDRTGFFKGISDKSGYLQTLYNSAGLDTIKNSLDADTSNVLGSLSDMLVNQRVPYGDYKVTGTPDPYNRGQFTLRIEGNVNGKNIEKSFTYSGEQAGAVEGTLYFNENGVNFDAK